ncbi:DUF4197 domain-containing protein [Sphingomonas parva]|uniref:DUF4197 domain-containing protein n=1 Tax=Sphingomonas parva TaxID=2555898 RepID=A0A4Y8ZSG1_9SPHN|nr:DUF4197 domain-containing protein [Sphingomonas parva]TFI57729.1 DUF4197 domain-containing protein [Sphingomonas parva]
MDQLLSRRTLLATGLAVPILALPGCASGLGGGFGLEDAIRRILTLSSQRAFAQLLTDEGFFQDELARVQLPSQLGGSAITRALTVALGTSAVQDRLLRLVNHAAADAADAAAPIVYDSIRTMTIADAVSLVRGGPTAATDFLQRSMGDAIVDAMFPGVGNALRIADNGLINRVLQTATGIDFTGLQADVARKAASGIYRAIGREEAAIRSNPQATGDPVLIGVFGLLR